MGAAVVPETEIVAAGERQILVLHRIGELHDSLPHTRLTRIAPSTGSNFDAGRRSIDAHLDLLTCSRLTAREVLRVDAIAGANILLDVVTFLM